MLFHLYVNIFMRIFIMILQECVLSIKSLRRALTMEKFELIKEIEDSGCDDSRSIFLVTLQSQAKGVDYHIDIPMKKWVLPTGTCRADAVVMAEEIATIISKRLRAKMAKQTISSLIDGNSLADDSVKELLKKGQTRGLDVLRLVGLSIEIEELAVPQSREALLLELHTMNFNNLYDEFS